MQFYLFYIDRINIVAKEYLLLNKTDRAGKCGGQSNVDDDEPGPSRRNGKSKRRKKPKLSCIPNPATLAW